MGNHCPVVPLLDLFGMFQGIAELLDAEGGVSLGRCSGPGSQIGMEDSVAGEAVCDAHENEDGCAEVHFHRRGRDRWI